MKFFQAFEGLTPKAWSDVTADVQSGDILETFQMPTSDMTEEQLFDIENLLLSRRLSEQERRERLDTMYPVETPRNQLVLRPIFDSDGDKWMAHLLLVSGMLKHMELIPDDDKRRIIGEVIAGWTLFAAFSLSIVPEVSRSKRITFNGVEYKLTMAEGLELGEIARRLSTMMPLSIARMAYGYLASEKLRDQIAQGVGDADHPPGQQFMRAAILADLGGPGVSEPLEAVARALQGKVYLSHVLIRKLAEVAIRFRLTDDDAQRIQALAGDLIASLEGKTGVDAGNRKSGVIQRIKNQRLLLTYRDDAAR